MTKRNYFQSLVIFIATGFFVHTVFKIDYWETFILLLLVIVCVFHTMDVRDDIRKRRVEHDVKKLQNGNGDGSSSSIHPES